MNHALRGGWALHSGRVYLGMFAFCAATAIPMSFFFYLLPATLRQSGQSAEVIGLVALVYLPYALRFFWAWLVDRFAAGDPLRYRRASLLMLALGTFSSFLFLATDPSEDVFAILLIALLVFFFLASGMTALDGYVLATLGEEGRRRVSVWQAAGFTVGGVGLGVLALLLDGHGWPALVLTMAVFTALLAWPVVLLPKVAQQHAVPSSRLHVGLWRFLGKAPVRRRMLVSLFTHGGLGLVTGYMPILQVDAGLSAAQVGLFGTVGANLMGLLASFIAGWLLLRRGAWKTLRLIGSAGVVCFLSAALLPALHLYPTYAVIMSLAVIVLGYAYVVPYRAVVLSFCEGDSGATQAACLSSLDVMVSIIFGALAGVTVAWIGLDGLFACAAAACLLGTLLSWRTPMDSKPFSSCIQRM